MSANLMLIAVVGVMVGCGTTLILERSLTRILVGFVLIGNGLNILFLVASGPRVAPILGQSGADGRSAAAGDGAHRDRHHARHDRLGSRRLPRVAAGPAPTTSRTTSRTI